MYVCMCPCIVHIIVVTVLHEPERVAYYAVSAQALSDEDKRPKSKIDEEKCRTEALQYAYASTGPITVSNLFILQLTTIYTI